MDRSWIGKPRISQEYKDGIQNFIEFASMNGLVNGKVSCPCCKCKNKHYLLLKQVHDHLTWNGFLTGYTNWFYHGESCLETHSSNLPQEHDIPLRNNDNHVNLDGLEDLRGLFSAAIGSSLANNVQNDVPFGEGDCCSNIPSSAEQPDLAHEEVLSPLQKMMNDCEKPLYPNCESFTVTSFILHIWNAKIVGGWSRKSVDMLFEILRNAFPQATLPASYYDAKKLIKELGLGYEKIDACPNDCMLYDGENDKYDSCQTCGLSRWENSKKDITEDSLHEVGASRRKKKKKPAKVLRYFPLIPRLKRLYMSKDTASSMRWHDEGRTKDGILRHPADALAWKAFDERYPDFAADPRNVRLGLASDGFNPFRTMSVAYSTWPVILMPYNMEPWSCMKKSSLILSMVIPGEKGPGNNIDVYLKPLIEELKQLWNGVEAYDALKGEHFILRASLMWTVNDFPAYANLSGWSTKGRVACPICASSTEALWLDSGGKYCYMCHRRWLDKDHLFRHQSDQFDGTVEMRLPPKPLSGVEILDQMGRLTNKYGKHPKLSKKRARDGGNIIDISATEGEGSVLWKKSSIFFELPYWKHNLLRHNLDVMHIEKNVCDNVIGTLLNIEGKTKDNEKARRDLKAMGIRPELHPIEHLNGKPYLPHACYTFTPAEKDLFLKVLKDLKVPDGYASNISRGVNLKERKLSNLKTHDSHVLMQDILPLALRGLLAKHVVLALNELSIFFKMLCSKTLRLEDLDELQNRAALVLCHLEKIFPPGFFTIMVHLIIHLPVEVKLGGPVQYRWMYPIERFLMTLKNYVRNKAQPEGSIAEGYIVEECMTFCKRFMGELDSLSNRPKRNLSYAGGENYLFSSGGHFIGSAQTAVLDRMLLAQAHRYVLLHSDMLETYRRKFISVQRNEHHSVSTSRIEGQWFIQKFADWLNRQVPDMIANDCSKELIALATGPNSVVRRFSGFCINGYVFHTIDREKNRKFQNSGIMVEADGQDYYGRLSDIVELNYFGSHSVVLFRGDWVDVKSPRGIKRDSNGLTLVNFSRLIHTGEHLGDDPFVFSSQVKQVFYVRDPKSTEWHQVVKMKPRDTFDLGKPQDDNDDDDDGSRQCMPCNVLDDDDEFNNHHSWIR